MSNPVIKSPYPQILTGTTAPTMTPSFIGQEYYNTADGSMYKAMGTSGYWNWGMVGRGSLSEFNKNTIPGIFAWWSADSGVTKDGGNLVSSWVDKINGWAAGSGGGTTNPLWQASAFNSQPGILFDGSNDYLILDHADTGTAFTTFSVLSVDATETSDSIIIYNAQYASIGVNLNPSQFYVGDDTFTKLGTYTVGNHYLLTMRVSGAAGTCYGQVNDGAETSVSTGYTETIDGTKFGGYWGTDAYNTKCYIMEHIIYNASLSAANIAIVQAYLNNKYAIY